MFGRLKHMFIKEFLQLLRDPRMRMITFAGPVIQMTVFAFALTTDVMNINTAVLDFDHTKSSREFVEYFTSSGYFEVTEYADSQSDIADILDYSRARLVINLPSGFEDDLLSGRTAKAQVLVDGTDSNTASIVFGYANRIVADYSRAKLVELENASGSAGMVGAEGAPFEIVTRSWFNPNLESKYYFVPGLIAVMILVISMVMTSVAIVREKEIGTIEQVMVTPITRTEFILGKTVPFAIVGYIVMTLMLIVAMLVFGIRVNGSIVLLYLLTGIYLFGNLGLALLISVTARTQQQAVLTAFLVMMPCVLLSGFLFPVHNMPEIIQYAAFLNPMRWYLDILRGVIIKGVGAGDILCAIVAQTVLACSFVMLAVSRFRKTMA